jgi:hypothetical protein
MDQQALADRYGMEAGTAALPLQPSTASASGLDWLIFLLADVKTGVGPFLATYLPRTTGMSSGLASP